MRYVLAFAMFAVALPNPIQAQFGGGSASGSAVPVAASPSIARPQDASVNFNAFSRSCYNDNDAARCNNLGTFYEIGHSIEVNRNIAISLYIRSCRLGNNIGCRNADNLRMKMNEIDRVEERLSRLTLSSHSDMILLHSQRCFIEPEWRRYLGLVDIFINGNMVHIKSGLRGNSDFQPIAQRAVDAANLAERMAQGATQRQSATGSCVPR